MNGPTGFEVITFDCYGTLIDWETGILAAVVPILLRHGLAVSSAEILQAYARAESAIQNGPYLPYHEVLRRAFVGMAKDLGFSPESVQFEILVEALPTWEPFPDTVEALKRLAARYRLGVISNIDEDLLAATRQKLDCDFDLIVTAEGARAYKPDPRPFQFALAELGIAPQKVLHVAQSLHHDAVPCAALGIPCVHVRRESGRGGARAVPAAEITPTWQVADLRALVALVEG